MINAPCFCKLLKDFYIEFWISSLYQMRTNPPFTHSGWHWANPLGEGCSKVVIIEAGIDKEKLKEAVTVAVEDVERWGGWWGGEGGSLIKNVPFVWTLSWRGQRAHSWPRGWEVFSINQHLRQTIWPQCALIKKKASSVRGSHLYTGKCLEYWLAKELIN